MGVSAMCYPSRREKRRKRTSGRYVDMAERVFPGLFLSSLSILVGIYYYTHMQKETMDVYRESGEGYGWIGGGSTDSKNLFPPPPPFLEEYHDRRMFAVSRALTYIRIVRKNSKSQKKTFLLEFCISGMSGMFDFFPP